MKMLFYSWSGITEKDAMETLQKMGVHITVLSHSPKNYNEDPDLLLRLEQLYRQQPFDCIFSFNYFPVISTFCNQMKIKYLSWVYDSPHLTLFSKTVFNDCNNIFLFDRCMYQEMIEIGAKHIHYLPLAVNTDRLHSLQSSFPSGYIHDISFVGTLYNDQYNFYDQIQYLPPHIKGTLDGLIQSQLQICGYDFLQDMITPEMCNEIFKYIHLSLGEEYLKCEKNIFLNILYRKISTLERQNFINTISQLFPTALYCKTPTPEFPSVINMGYSDPYTQTPMVFKRSRINLNITLRSIQSGIPLRILDIMGAGGFVLSNYQSELSEYFDIGTEIVIYENLNDCLEKIDYYLKHDELREKIAQKGHEKVVQLFTYERQLGKLLEAASP